MDALDLVLKATAADRLPALLIQGGRDNAGTVQRTRDLHAALVAAGFNANLLELPQADHPGILDVADSVDAVMALAGA